MYFCNKILFNLKLLKNMNENEIWRNIDLNDLPNEIWLPIEGYENYQVSNMGRVKSLGNDKSRKEKILRQGKNHKGYLFVILYKEGKLKSFRVHRLVANAFIPNPNNYPTVNHKNEIKTDNRVDNLEWMNMKQQINHGTCIQRRAEKERNGVLSKQVYQYDKNYNLIKIWTSTQECDRNGYNHGAVSACCRSELKHYKNYIWSYIPIDLK